MSQIKNDFVFLDQSSVSHFLNLIGGQISSNIGSIQKSDLLNLLIQAIKYGISYKSGIPIEVKFKSDIISLYAKRLVKKDPYSFDEISAEYVKKHSIPTKEEDGYIYALEYIKSMPANELFCINQSTVSIISNKLADLIKTIEREREYEIFKDKKGHLVEGVVSRLESGSVILDIDGSEGFLPKTELIPGEFINVGDRLYAYVREVRMSQDSPKHYQILLNRSSPEFIIKLIEANVPEVANGSLVIKGCSRRSGKLSKVSLYGSVDPVWACVGKGGAKLKSIRLLMANEVLHIIRWANSPAEYIYNALYPLEAVKIIFESDNEVEVVLTEDSYNKSLSRDRIQIRLASSLTKYKIKVLSENEEQARINEEKSQNEALLKSLELEDETVEAFLDAGLNSLEALMESSDEEIHAISTSINISEFKAKVAKLIHKRHENEYLAQGVNPILLKIPSLVFDISILVEYGVKEKADLAKLGTEIIVNMLRKQFYASGVSEEAFVSLAQEIELWSKAAEV